MGQVEYFPGKKSDSFGAELSSKVVPRGLAYWFDGREGGVSDEGHPVFRHQKDLVALLERFATAEHAARTGRPADKSGAAADAAQSKRRIEEIVADIEASYAGSPYRDDAEAKLGVVDLWEPFGADLSMAGDVVDFAAQLNRWPTDYERDSLIASQWRDGTLQVTAPVESSDPAIIVRGAPRAELARVVEELKHLVDQAEDRLSREAQLHDQERDNVWEELQRLLRPSSSP